MKLENEIDIKIFILYLLHNVKEPLNYDTVHDIVVQDEFVNHFDFAICFSELLERGQIDEIGGEGERLYIVSETGKEALESYAGSLLTIIKDRALRSALRLIAFNRSGDRVIAKITDAGAGYNLHCAIVDNEKIILSTDVFLTDKSYAERLKKNFDENAEKIYNGVMALLSGDVNFIFDD